MTKKVLLRTYGWQMDEYDIKLVITCVGRGIL